MHGLHVWVIVCGDQICAGDELDLVLSIANYGATHTIVAAQLINHLNKGAVSA